MVLRLIPRALLGAFVILVCLAAPAGAAISLSTFGFTPSTTQAGAHPDMTLDVTFAGDTAKDLTLSLPPGLWASPAAAPACSESTFQNGTCPAASQIGSGNVGATAILFLLPIGITSPAKAYLVAPQSAGEAARIGLKIFSPVGIIRAEAPVTLRTSPTTGLEIAFANLPNNILALPVTINSIHLTFNGTVNGHSFWRSPTSCAAAPIKLGVNTYPAPGTVVNATSTFTPTGCDTLAFDPGNNSAIAIDPAPSDGVALRVGITQPDDQAALKSLKVTLPGGLFARIPTLLNACAAPDPGTCPASATLGSATAVTPLLDTPLTGRLVLSQRPGGLPGLTAVFPAPFALRITGDTDFVDGHFVEDFASIPDLPLSALNVNLDGGATSLFEAFNDLCSGPAALGGDLSAHNGATKSAIAPVTVTGCRPLAGLGGRTPTGAPAAGSPAGGGASTATGTSAGAVKATGKLTLRGLGGSSPRLGLTVTVPRGAPGMKVMDVRLPKGLKVSPSKVARGVQGLFDGRPAAGRASGRSRSVRAASLDGAGAHGIVVILRGASLRVDRALARQVRAHRGGTLTVAIVVKDALGKTSTLALRAKAV